MTIGLVQTALRGPDRLGRPRELLVPRDYGLWGGGADVGGWLALTPYVYLLAACGPLAAIRHDVSWAARALGKAVHGRVL